jgi:hypothetical protein
MRQRQHPAQMRAGFNNAGVILPITIMNGKYNKATDSLTQQPPGSKLSKQSKATLAVGKLGEAWEISQEHRFARFQGSPVPARFDQGAGGSKQVTL